jgi:hypothetical protein
MHMAGFYVDDMFALGSVQYPHSTCNTPAERTIPGDNVVAFGPFLHWPKNVAIFSCFYIIFLIIDMTSFYYLSSMLLIFFNKLKNVSTDEQQAKGANMWTP